jgi:hypothetical protein
MTPDSMPPAHINRTKNTKGSSTRPTQETILRVRPSHILLERLHDVPARDNVAESFVHALRLERAFT